MLVVVRIGYRQAPPALSTQFPAGAAIEMEMTLFFRLCPGPILGITGTKGKTTTTLLAGAMLREQYPDTVVAGNLRVSAHAYNSTEDVDEVLAALTRNRKLLA